MKWVKINIEEVKDHCTLLKVKLETFCLKSLSMQESKLDILTMKISMAVDKKVLGSKI